jgi:hypothetical protein
MGGAPKLRQILDRETGSFQRIDNFWRPAHIFADIYTKQVLQDMVRRLKSFREAEDEMKLMTRGAQLLGLVRQLGFIVKRAYFVRQMNHLSFSLAVTEYYMTLGKIFRLLKVDQARGLL